MPSIAGAKHDQGVKPDVPAGLGFLAVALAAISIEIVLIINRRRLARWLVEGWVSHAARASPKWRWLHGTFARDVWQDTAFRDRALVWAWLPPVLIVPVFGAVFLLGAVNAFRGSG